MKTIIGKSNCPPDGGTSGERNAKAVEALALDHRYSSGERRARKTLPILRRQPVAPASGP